MVSYLYNLPVNVIIKLPHPRSGDSQGLLNLTILINALIFMRNKMMLWLSAAAHVVCPKLFPGQFQLTCYVWQNTKVSLSLESKISMILTWKRFSNERFFIKSLFTKNGKKQTKKHKNWKKNKKSTSNNNNNKTNKKVTPSKKDILLLQQIIDV